MWKVRRPVRFSVSVLNLAALLFLPACQRPRRDPASVVEASDASVSNQLTAGFYGIEENRYRWTAQAFSVALRPPFGADEKGARLQLQLFIPDSQIEKLGPMTLTADVDGEDLAPETISKPGAITYSRDIPASALQSNLVEVHFSFDKSARPGNGDSRELAAVVSKVGLLPN